jgi:hypothetical protein
MRAVVEVSAAGPSDQVIATVTEESLIAGLCRDACHDASLLAIAGEREIVAEVERMVHDLWSESRVKTFIGVLALRDVRAAVNARHPEGGAASPTPVTLLGENWRPATDDDVLTASDDGTLD